MHSSCPCDSSETRFARRHKNNNPPSFWSCVPSMRSKTLSERPNRGGIVCIHRIIFVLEKSSATKSSKRTSGTLQKAVASSSYSLLVPLMDAAVSHQASLTALIVVVRSPSSSEALPTRRSTKSKRTVDMVSKNYSLLSIDGGWKQPTRVVAYG